MVVYSYHSLIQSLIILFTHSFTHSFNQKTFPMQILRTGQCEADKCPVVSQQQEGLRALAPRCLSTYTGPLGLPPHTVGLVSERHRERTREIRFSDRVSSLWKMLISLQVILSQGFSKHSFAFLPLLPVLIKSYPASGPCRMLSGAS